ncbi:MAG TPA: nuclear transport factor 2 family protein [Chloroflexota bacterium]|nr:nuclear transport factor 2 family protein [Chloroflexota bacterium]
MTSKNLPQALAFVDAVARRDPDAVTALMAPDGTFIDHAMGQIFKGREQIKVLASSWFRAFPDQQPADLRTTDAGETVVVQLTWLGTHAGPLGELPATGGRMALPACNVFRFDPRGELREVECYYCGARLLSQLGQSAPPVSHPARSGSQS